MTGHATLAIRNLSKTFPGQVALRNVDLTIKAGEVHALCGQNGSGKSTLIKVLSGFHSADPGSEIRFLGELLDTGRHKAPDSMRFIHQDLGLIGSLDAAENLALGTLHDRPALLPLKRKKGYRDARRALVELGMDIDVTVPIATLAPVERAMIAIARAMQGWDGGRGLLVLDEPTVSLPSKETARLFEAIRRVKDRGAAVLYVSHHLEEVFELADRVSVLRDGGLVATAPIEEINHAELVEAIVGRAIDAGPTRVKSSRQDDVRLEVRELSTSRLRDLSFNLEAGEIVGVTGLIGSGIEQLPEVIFGACPLEGGTIMVDGEDVGRLTPQRAIKLGIGLVPDDRSMKGCILTHSIRENMTLPELDSLASTFGGVNVGRERQEAAQWASRVELQAGSLERPIGQLSGGNQQKVLIARWLRTRPAVLLLHEPTQGVDIGAKAAIHGLIAEAAASGMAVLTVSTDTEELAETANRVLVMDQGQLIEQISGPDLTAHNLTVRTLAAGQTAVRA